MSPEQIKQIIEKERVEGEKEIQKEKATFYNTPFEGELPENFVENFKRAIFSLAPREDNIASVVLKAWAAKPVSELTFGEIGKMSDVITTVPRERLFKDFDDAQEKLRPIELLTKSIRERNDVFEFGIKKKEDELANRLHKKGHLLATAPGQIQQKSTNVKAGLTAVAK